MRRSRYVVPVILLGTALTGCGGDDDGGGGRAVSVTTGQVTVEARDIAFDVTRIETAPGPLEVTLDEVGALAHTFVIEGIDDFKLAVNGEPTDTGTVELEAGEYEYYCDIPGHRGQGMEGTIVVE
jgi:plastocyanin